MGGGDSIWGHKMSSMFAERSVSAAPTLLSSILLDFSPPFSASLCVKQL